jgi:peptidoglycan/LPS O-acetylase OafA/YrhL
MGAGRNNGLDGLRGLAALLVILYHSILVDAYLVDVMLATVQSLSGHDLVAKIILACVSGANAVLLFFVLSGFVLTLSFDKMEGTLPVIVYNFVVRRLCRLYPAMFFAMALVFVVSNVELSLGHENFQRGATLSWVVQNALLWNISVHGATWTIQAELIAIPFLLIALTLTALSGVFGRSFVLSMPCSP